MKKHLIAVICILAILSLLTAALLLQPSPSTLAPISQGIAQPTSQNSSQVPSSPVPTPVSQNKTLNIVTPPPPPRTFTNTSTQSQQSSFHTIPSNTKRPSDRTLQEAVGNATIYLAETQDPYGLLMINVLYRRFGITQFADSMQRYDQLLAQNPDNAPILRIFRRIADYSNELQPTDFSAVTADVDKITVPALYSNRFSLPEDYQSKLNDAANSGGYLLTHTLLAIIWLQDNNCGQLIPDDFKTFVYQANAGLIGDSSVVNDIQLEAAAFLYAAGQGEFVNDAFVRRVIAAQNYDGGWSSSSDVQDGSFWHASVLALMLLLNVEFPATSYMPMIASAPTNSTVYFNPLLLCLFIVWLFTFGNVRKKLYRFDQDNKLAAL